MKGLRKGAEAHAKTLMRAERGLNKIIHKNAVMMDADSLHFEDKIAANNAELDKARHHIQDRAEAMINDAKLLGDKYIARGELKMNRTLPKAISTSEREIEQVGKNIENKVKSDERYYTRLLKRLDNGLHKEFRRASKNAVAVGKDANRRFDGALVGFDRDVKDLSKGGILHNTIAMNKAMRDAGRTVERISDGVEREKKDSDNALEKMDSSLEESVGGEIQSIESSSSNEKALLSRRAEMVNTNLAQITVQNQQSAARTADSYSQLTGTLAVNNDREMEHQQGVIHSAEETIEGAENDVDNDIKVKVGDKEKLLVKSQSAMKSMLSGSEMDFENAMTKSHQNIQTIKNTLEGRVNSDKKLNNDDVVSMEEESKGQLDRLIEAEDSVHASMEGLPDIQSVVGNSYEGANDVLKEMKGLKKDITSLMNPRKASEDNMKYAVRGLQSSGSGELNTIQGIDSINVNKAQGILHELVANSNEEIDKDMKNELSHLASAHSTSINRIKEILAKSEVDEANQVATTGRMRDNIADVERDEKTAKGNFGKRMSHTIALERDKSKKEYHHQLMKLEDEEKKAQDLLFKSVRAATSNLLSGGKANELEILHSVNGLLRALDVVHGSDIKEDNAIANANSKYKNILPLNDREIDGIDKAIQNEKMRLKNEFHASDVSLTKIAMDRSRKANITIKDLQKAIKELEIEVTRSKDTMLTSAREGTTYIDKFIGKLREIMMADAELDKNDYRQGLYDMNRKYASLSKFTNQRGKTIGADMDSYANSSYNRHEALANTLARVINDAQQMGLSEEEMQEYVKKRLAEEANMTEEQFEQIHDTLEGDLTGFRDKMIEMKRKADDEVNDENNRIDRDDSIQMDRLADHAQMVGAQALKAGNIIGYNSVAGERSYRIMNNQQTITGNRLRAMMHVAQANSGSLIDDIAAAKGVSTTRIASVMDAVTSYMILIKSFMDEMKAELGSVKGRLSNLQEEYGDKINRNTKEYMKPALMASEAMSQFDSFQRESEPLQNVFRSKAKEMMDNVKGSADSAERIADGIADRIDKGASDIENIRQKVQGSLDRHVAQKKQIFVQQLLKIADESSKPLNIVV
ncbi:hypothetical protein, conserved [Perkinsus marinus ATCC 50983]|uniref:Uncharacterized protein n=1 Tax=Perkinsus marinus (strain ATCC 50983 / TXsc) TaxID=423536 RepID=C5KS50_PERM5|nr:hypothetical protein, conserved [Perkinsus marinus ATCC 50983]EER12741.1 hypothetical protein, conserved [Perkinsus marinus ATCC 50983]|eukprot:XP_002780946.1 hypothetical protein, conserved [Perkinsus marinus ATCC 50983]